MRILSENIKNKLSSRIQAGNSSISANLWVSRPNTQLTEDIFLEKQLALPSKDITKASIAVSHPRMMRDAADIYLGYIESGTAKIIKAVHNHRMSRHIWSYVEFAEEAEDISLCFNGTMPKNTSGAVEFITEDKPWAFWIKNGTLYGRKLGDKENTILAESNCRAISSVRAMWSELGNFDFGLIIFFILGGYLYYRQFIDGEWCDAEIVNAGPAGVLWSDVSAFRTWDYRVGVQLVAQDGSIYELFTQFMGIGKQNAEHIEIKGVAKDSNLVGINYHTYNTSAEHIEIKDAKVITPYKGILAVGTPSIIDVYNVDDGTGNWGKCVVFVFDKELKNESVQASIGSFYFIDATKKYYFPSEVSIDDTGRKAQFTFADINDAIGECIAYYEPGTVVSMVNEMLPAQSFVFTPKNLTFGGSMLPEVAEIWNTNEIGTEIAIRFTRPLVAVPADAAEKFIVTISEPNYVPDGILIDSIKPVVDISAHNLPEEGIEQIIDLTKGNITSLTLTDGKLTLEAIHKDSVLGLRRFKENPDLASLEFNIPYMVDFVSNGKTYIGIARTGTIVTATNEQYDELNYGINLETLDRDEVYNNQGGTPNWRDIAYRTIEVIKCEDETTEKWLLANTEPATEMEDDSIVGTWIFNDKIDILTDYAFYVKFRSHVGGTTPSGVEYSLMYIVAKLGLYYSQSGVVGEAVGAYMQGDWNTAADGAKIIDILEEPTDEACKTWLKANAKKVVSV